MTQNLYPCPECGAGQSLNTQVYQEFGSLQGRRLPCTLCDDNQKVNYERLRKYFEVYGDSSMLNQYILNHTENSEQQ